MFCNCFEGIHSGRYKPLYFLAVKRIAPIQAEFLNDAVYKVLSLYAGQTNVSNVVVVAHSMSGMVARAAPLLRNYVAGSIASIVTLSTPHQRFVRKIAAD